MLFCTQTRTDVIAERNKLYYNIYKYYASKIIKRAPCSVYYIVYLNDYDRVPNNFRPYILLIIK